MSNNTNNIDNSIFESKIRVENKDLYVDIKSNGVLKSFNGTFQWRFEILSNILFLQFFKCILI